MTVEDKKGCEIAEKYLRKKYGDDYVDFLETEGQSYLDGFAEDRKDRNCVNCSNHSSNLRKENAELNRDKTELVNSVTELKTKVTELEKENEQLECDLYNTNANLQHITIEYEKENAELKAQNKDLCESLDIMNNRESELLDQIERMKKDFSNALDSAYSNQALYELWKRWECK